MQRVRIFVYCILTIFMADIAYADAAMMTAPHQAQTQAEAVHCHDMHTGVRAEFGAKMTDEAHCKHFSDKSTSASHEKCDTCHDCLACFSMLPVTETPLVSVYPAGMILQAFVVIYHAPHLITFQRPPILA